MLLTCPHCATIFRIDAESIGPDGQRVRCSVCHHIWVAAPLAAAQKPGMVAWHFGRFVGKPLLGAFVGAGLVAAIIINRATITAYMPFLISGFDSVGLAIHPPVSQLQVVDLNASYAGDTMRLSGALHNNGFWRSHAADLQVTVRANDGAIVNETVIRPDLDLIEGDKNSRFFVQIALEAATEAHVTVTPLANRIYR